MLKKIYPYILAGASVFGMSNCRGNSNEIPTRDVEVQMGRSSISQARARTAQLLADPEVRYVIIIPYGDWTGSGPNALSMLIDGEFRPLFAPANVRGNGVDGIHFREGAINRADSIFLEQNRIPVNRVVNPRMLTRMKQKYYNSK